MKPDDNVLNFNELFEKIEVATKKAFLEISNKEEIYGFALYSDENCETLWPIANTKEYLQKTREEYEDPECMLCKFGPPEWNYQLKGAKDEFMEICQILKKEFQKNKKKEDFLKYQSDFYEGCFNTLKKLENDGFFKNNVKRDIFLVLDVTEYEFKKDFLLNMVSELNNNRYKKEYIEWVNTWAD